MVLRTKDELSGYGLEDWFIDVFHDAIDQVLKEEFADQAEKPAPSFMERCANAAEAAYIINSLQQRKKRLGFQPDTLARFFKRLAKDCGISLQTLAMAIGVTAIDFSINNQTVHRLSAFARKIGLTINELRLCIRIEWAETKGHAQIDAIGLRARDDQDSGARMASLEKYLSAIESDYPPEEREQLSGLMAEIHKIYSTEN